MRKTISSGVYQANTPKFYISILITMVLIFGSSIDGIIRAIQQQALLPDKYSTTFMKNALATDTVVSLLPVVAALPFAGVYVDDLKSKFARFYLIRSDYGCYLWDRVWMCFLCGGGVILLGGLLSWGMAALLFMPMERVAEIGTVSAASIWMILVLFFLTGGLWSVVGMAMSTFMESKYIAYASPFVFYYLLVILYERYCSDLFIIYPKIWTDPAAWPFGCWGAAIFLLEMTLIFAILFAFRAGRRLQQL